MSSEANKITGEDSSAIRRCADELKHLSAKLYDPPDAVRPTGIESHRKIADRASEVAVKIDARRVI